MLDSKENYKAVAETVSVDGQLFGSMGAVVVFVLLGGGV